MNQIWPARSCSPARPRNHSRALISLAPSPQQGSKALDLSLDPRLTARRSGFKRPLQGDPRANKDSYLAQSSRGAPRLLAQAIPPPPVPVTCSSAPAIPPPSPTTASDEGLQHLQRLRLHPAYRRRTQLPQGQRQRQHPLRKDLRGRSPLLPHLRPVRPLRKNHVSAAASSTTPARRPRHRIRRAPTSPTTCMPEASAPTSRSFPGSMSAETSSTRSGPASRPTALSPQLYSFGVAYHFR